MIVKILAPPLAPDSSGPAEMDMVGISRLLRAFQEGHPGLGGCKIPFPGIAYFAAGHKIIPAGFPASGFRDHMVQGQIRGIGTPPAVLARIFITDQDVLLGGMFFPHMRGLDVMEQTDHRGDGDFERGRMKVTGRRLFTGGHAF